MWGQSGQVIWSYMCEGSSLSGGDNVEKCPENAEKSLLLHFYAILRPKNEGKHDFWNLQGGGVSRVTHPVRPPMHMIISIVLGLNNVLTSLEFADWNCEAKSRGLRVSHIGACWTRFSCQGLKEIPQATQYHDTHRQSRENRVLLWPIIGTHIFSSISFMDIFNSEIKIIGRCLKCFRAKRNRRREGRGRLN